MARTIDCPCGEATLTGPDDDDLFRQARRHVEEHHPDMARSDEEIRGMIASMARDT
jgi:hypothetical protein